MVGPSGIQGEEKNCLSIFYHKNTVHSDMDEKKSMR